MRSANLIAAMLILCTGQAIAQVSGNPAEGNILSGRSAESDSIALFSPVFGITGGFYNGPLSVTLTCALTGADLRYTTDGSEPGSMSPLYTGPIALTITTALRARSFTSEGPQGSTVTQTYFINEPVNLPFISIATDPGNFFDDQTGIYVTGTNGIRGDCDPTIRNLNQDWERAVNIELYEKNGTQAINQEAGIKIYGGCSRTRFPQKSLALYARKIYGKGSFEYQLFPDKNIFRFESFVLRSSADDQVNTFMRDALAQYASVGVMDMDIQAYRPAVVFLNGAYWGIHDIREKISEHYFESNYNIDKDNLNILQGSGFATYGDPKGYADLLNFIAANDLSSPFNYNFIKTQINIDEFIDYEILHIYLAEKDWPGNNIKFWNSATRGFEKWRWICYDLDQTFIYASANSLGEATATDGSSWPNPPWSTFLLRSLLENQGFRDRFIQRYALCLRTAFDEARLTGLAEEFRDRMVPEMPRHISRWGGQLDPDFHESWAISPTFSSLGQWLGNVNYLIDFINHRQSYAISHLENKFGLKGMSSLKISTNIPGSGSVWIYDRKIPETPFSAGFFNEVPLQVRANANPGYKFLRWECQGSENSTYTSDEISLAIRSDEEIKAIFEEDNDEKPSIIINEISYNASLASGGDWIELFNRKDNTIDLSGWKLRDGNSRNLYIFPSGTRISSKRYLTVCEDIDRLSSRFPHAADCIGNTGFGLKNDGEVIRLYNDEERLIDSVHYGNGSPWPSISADEDYSIILLSPELDNDLPENWTTSQIGSPGRNNNEITGIPEDPSYYVHGSTLGQNYPNPCSSTTSISYSLRSAGHVIVRFYDISGIQLPDIINTHHNPGSYSAVLDVGSLSHGLYFYSMYIDGIFAGARKLIVSH